jgi:hypothetical protein
LPRQGPTTKTMPHDIAPREIDIDSLQPDRHSDLGGWPDWNPELDGLSVEESALLRLNASAVHHGGPPIADT